MKRASLFLLHCFCAFNTSAQYQPILPLFKDSSTYKLVIRTEEHINDRYESRDNFTVRLNGDTSVVFYNDYGDGLISRVMIPYSIFDVLTRFEDLIISRACEKPDCNYSILFEVGDFRLRVPVDILDAEQVSSLMLELEQ
jgi:hypothetical protein